MVKNFLKLQLFIVLLASGSILNADPYSLANVSQYLTNLKLLKANFLQFNADGTTSSGVIFINGKPIVILIALNLNNVFAGVNT